MAVILTDETIANAARLQVLRGEMALLRAEETKLRDQILASLGEDPRGLTGSGAPAVHVEYQHRRVLDRSRLEAMFPEIWEQVHEEKISTVLKVDLAPPVATTLSDVSVAEVA